MADNLTYPFPPGSTVATKQVGGTSGPHLQKFVRVDENGDPVSAGDATAEKQEDLKTLLGAVNEAAPASDTASSGVSGRLQRIAQNITTFMGRLPASLGAKAASASLAVTASTEDVARIGATNESAAGSDTATSGLNGLIKRGLAGITSLLSALGAIGDAAWSSGNGSVIALLKTIAASASSTAPVQAVGLSLRLSASFSRPANTTAYDIGDLVANNTTAGSVTPMTFAVAASSGGKGLIRSVKIDKAGAAATFRAHFFLAAPTVANGDNGAFSTTKVGYLGYIDVVTAAFSDGAAGIGLGEVPFDLTSGTDVACLLEARTAFTPTSGGAFAVEVTAWPEV